MTQPSEPNGLVAFHINRRKKEYFLNSRSTSALSQRGESYFTLLAHYFPGSRLLAKFIGSKKN